MFLIRQVREEMTLLAAVPTGCGMCSTNQIGRKYYYTGLWS